MFLMGRYPRGLLWTLPMSNTGMAEEREKLIMTMREKVEWQSMEDDERVAVVLNDACRDD